MTFLRTAHVAAISILPLALALPALAGADVRPTPRPDAPVYADLPVAPQILPVGVQFMKSDVADFIGPRLPEKTDMPQRTPDAG